MEKLKIGFVGVGNMGQCAHLQNYANLPDCAVVALAEIRPGLAKEVAARYGIPRVYATHKELLANEKLDGIVATQPFGIHGQLLPQLFSAGIPVFTEKPLASSLPVGKQLLSVLKASGGKHYLGYHKRSDPATVYAKKEISRLQQTGELGRLRYVRVVMPAGDWIAGGFNHLLKSDEGYPSLQWDPVDPSFDKDTAKKHKTFVNYYIHQINAMRHFLGENYQVAFADPAGILLAVKSNSGVTGCIEMSPYTTTVDWQEEILVAFERGYIKVELPAPLAHNRPGKVTLYRDPEGETPQQIIPQLPWIHAMRQQALHFIQAIRGESTPLCEAAEALEDLQAAQDYIEMLPQTVPAPAANQNSAKPKSLLLHV